MDWLKEAEDDLESARCLLRGEKYSKACFHAQQAAEKAMKALLIRRCNRYEEVHSVVFLLDAARGILSIPDELPQVANRLDRHYIPSRYPNAWPSGAPYERYSREDAEEALRDATRILEFAKKSIG
jgi:HEPN domain-containing protein